VALPLEPRRASWPAELAARPSGRASLARGRRARHVTEALRRVVRCDEYNPSDRKE
jgi:hypothetical protein